MPKGRARLRDVSIAHSGENLRGCPFFRSFPNEVFDQILPRAESKVFQQGETILKEGDLNSELFFLVSGVLGIYVQGELVARVENVGEVIGEMSIITSNPVSASVVSLTRSELLSVKSRDFSDVVSEDSDKFQKSLYRVFSYILADRLQKTNDKAKRFELTNRQLQDVQEALQEANLQLERKVEERTADLHAKTKELIKSHQELEQKNTAILASYRKLEDLNYTKQAILNKLTDLHNKHLSGLQMSLGALRKNGDDRFKKETSVVSHELQKVMDLIRPLTSAHTSEMAMKSKRVLLLEHELKQQIIAKMALGGTGVRLDVASNLNEGRKYLGKHIYDIVCLGSEFIELKEFATQRNSKVKFVFMTSEDIPQYLLHLRNNDDLSSVVVRNDEDRLFTIKNIITTVSKLINQDYFGLEKYLGWGVDVQERPVRSSDQRKDLVEEMAQYFESMGIRRSLLERCAIVAEELLMNAIYDAPVDENGRSIYNHLSRRVKVELKLEEQGLFRYACDGSLAAISVQDPFGTLKRDTILTYLDGCFEGKVGQMNESKNKGGAGMGLFQLIGTSDLSVFNVHPAVRTEVISLFNADPLKSKTVTKPSFHLFYR